MNTETGQIKPLLEITKEEVLSGHWVGISPLQKFALEGMTNSERLEWWKRETETGMNEQVKERLDELQRAEHSDPQPKD